MNVVSSALPVALSVSNKFRCRWQLGDHLIDEATVKVIAIEVAYQVEVEAADVLVIL